jgi:hypothetical protein
MFYTFFGNVISKGNISIDMTKMSYDPLHFSFFPFSPLLYSFGNINAKM